MKKVTRFMSMVIAVIMLVSLVPMSVMAAQTNVKTKVGTIDEIAIDSDGTVSYATDNAYSGSRSLKIITDENETFILPSDPLFKSGIYDFEYYVYPKSVGTKLYARMGFNGTENNVIIYEGGTMKTGQLNSKTYVEAVSDPSVGSGTWYKVTGTGYSTNEGPSIYCGLLSIIGVSEVYIDDLKITRRDGMLMNNPSSGFEVYEEGTGAIPTSVEGITVSNAGGSIGKEGSFEIKAKEFLGTRALYVNNTGSKYTGQRTMYVGKRSDFNLNTEDTYRMEFYMYPVNWHSVIKGTAYRMYVQLNANSRGHVWANDAKDAFSLPIDTSKKFTITKVTEGSKAGWYKFTSQDLKGVGSWDPNLFIIEAGVEVYIDDITMYKVTNGNAEVYAKKDFEKHYDLAKNLMTTQVSGTQLSVSWRNPSNPEAEEIRLYDAETNELLSNDFATTGDGLNEFIDTDFVAGSEKNYRVDFVYADGEVRSQVTGIMPSGSGWNYQIGSWSMVSGTTQKPPAILEVDDTVGKTSAPSIRMASNEELHNATQAVLQLKANTKLDPKKKYRVSGWAKKNKAGYIYDRILNSDNTSRLYIICGKWDTYQTADWVEFSGDYYPQSEDYAVINFTFVAGVEDFWIDDVACYELDAEGNPTGENLVAGIGALDSGIADAPLAPSGVKATNDVEKAIISWGETDAQYVAVYDNAMSADIPVAYVPASIGYVDMVNLTSGKTYEYTVKAINAEGRESAEGVLVTAIPKAEALIIGDYETTANGNNVTVSIDIKNNEAGNDVTAQLILAVYNDVTLSDITWTTATTIPQTASGADPVTLSKAVTVPEGYRLVMYLWNSLQSMRPLKPCQEY